MTRITVTGHRPDKLGGYKAFDNFRAIRRNMRDFLEEAPEGGIELVSGGALGIDQLWMEVGLYLGFPVIAALPFEGYDSKWPKQSRENYQKLLDRCEEVRYICEPGYEARKLQVRNEWMVDNSDSVLAYWDGSSGGTSNCIDYAAVQGKPITIVDIKKLLEL